MIENNQSTENSIWLCCPKCGGKTRDKIRVDTTMTNYPLYCPKCKKEILVNIHQLNIEIIEEPDA